MRRRGHGSGPLSRARVVALALLLLTVPEAASPAEIVDLVPVVRGHRIFVSFRIQDAFTEEIEHAVATGLEVRFRYNVELKRDRGIWPDEKVSARRIDVSVTYDNLMKRYSLTREIDGEFDATRMVEDAHGMRHFMTTFESLALFDVSLIEPNEEYYLRVNAVTRDRNLLLFIPWDAGADWKEAHFTYVP